MATPSLRAKRSNPSFRMRGDHGLLRGACHRAALRDDPLARNDGFSIRNNSQQTCFCKRVATSIVDGRLMLTDALLNRRS